jgi:hypothetical protein
MTATCPAAICGGGQLPEIPGGKWLGLLLGPKAPRCDMDGCKYMPAMPAFILSMFIKSLVEMRARESPISVDPSPEEKE